ncbi:lactate racemase domain-containing protein [Aeoliella sp.]|uniref:lactate racemase domain-containing protein n=1 Tax=Aeoliella sp. TaxID=2795800 RepID=UPI003CCBE5C2
MSIQAHVQLGELPPLEISLRDEAWLGGGDSAESTRLTASDVVAATTAALESPVGFPPLAQATVPGDHVAIAIGAGVRQADDVVRGVLAALEATGGQRSLVQVVTGSVEEANKLRNELRDLTDDGLVVVGHVSGDDDSLCYLAAVEDEPLMISRQLFEADLVIPVGCGRLSHARDARGVYESIYPRFADVLTQRRYAQADALDSPTAGMIRRRETDQAGWLLGSALVVQVIPARGGGVAQVVAGAPDDVARVVDEVGGREWALAVEQPAQLVVATLAGGPEEQTWENVARALHTAGTVADMDQSAVAICTQLDTPPGGSLQELIATGGNLDRAAQLHDAQTDDAQAAWEIYKALCRGPVYFMSQLEPDVVEDLGMTHIASTDELARLAQRSASCIVLNEVQHTVPKWAE